MRWRAFLFIGLSLPLHVHPRWLLPVGAPCWTAAAWHLLTAFIHQPVLPLPLAHASSNTPWTCGYQLSLHVCFILVAWIKSHSHSAELRLGIVWYCVKAQYLCFYVSWSECGPVSWRKERLYYRLKLKGYWVKIEGVIRETNWIAFLYCFSLLFDSLCDFCTRG